MDFRTRCVRHRIDCSVGSWHFSRLRVSELSQWDEGEKCKESGGGNTGNSTTYIVCPSDEHRVRTFHENAVKTVKSPKMLGRVSCTPLHRTRIGPWTLDHQPEQPHTGDRRRRPRPRHRPRRFQGNRAPPWPLVHRSSLTTTTALLLSITHARVPCRTDRINRRSSSVRSESSRCPVPR